MELKVKIDATLQDLIPVYLESRREEIKTIESLLKTHRFEDIAAIAKALKGAATGYGFKGLTEIAKHLEKAADKKDEVAVRNVLLDYNDYLTNLQISFHAAAA